MGFFRRRETREIHDQMETNQATVMDVDGLLSAMRESDSISVNDAMQVPCFASCVSFLSSTVAMLPIKLYREGEGETAEVTDDPRVRFLNDESGDVLDSFQMKSAFVSDYLVYGNGYIYIDMSGNKVKGLYYVDARNVSYRINSDPIFKSASYMVQGKKYPTYRFISLLRKSKNGVTGTGIFDEGKETLATAYNTKIYQHYNILNGGNKNGLLQTKSKLTQDALDILTEKWRQFRNNKNKKPMVLNEGLEFKEISATSVEMQLNEHIKTNNEEICLLFGLAPEIISGKADADSFSDGVRTAVQPILEALQCALNRCLLLEEEKEKMYFAFDTTELLKGDILKRYQAYQIALASNFMQIDEVRYKEDLPKLGFNYVKLGLSDVLLDIKGKTVYTPNTNQTAKIGAQGLKNEENSGIIEEAEEKRYNDKHDPKTGKFASKDGGNLPTSSQEGPSPTGANEFEVKGFVNKQKLNNHWKDHGEEYKKEGIITTKEAYEKRALQLIESPVGGSIKGHIDKDGHVVRYDEKTNDFVKGNPKKGIFTMYKPKESGVYYDRQKKEDIKHGGRE